MKLFALKLIFVFEASDLCAMNIFFQKKALLVKEKLFRAFLLLKKKN